jgi:hypothetical protein
MNKFLATAAVAATLACAALPAYADKIYQVDGFAGGEEISTNNGSYCVIGSNDIGNSNITATALAAKANVMDVDVYNASYAGWGFQSYGGNSCTNVYAR